MQREIAAKQEKTVPGVIETIADGFSLALARPLLFLVPLILDLYYWAGWKISIDSLVSPIRRWVLESNAAGANDVAEQLESIGRADITWLLSFFVPSLLSETPRGDLYELESKPLFSPDQWWIGAPLLIVMTVGAVFLLAAYAVPISDATLNRVRSPKQTVDAILIAWFRLLGTLLAVVGIALLLFGPLIAVSGLMLVAGINAAPLLGLGAALFLLFAYFSLWFAPDAVVVSEVGPFDAIKYSVAILRGYLWPTVGFILASMVIGIGLGQIWREFVDTPHGLVVGLVANVFFATGLAMASMTFYANRINLLKPGSIKEHVAR